MDVITGIASKVINDERHWSKHTMGAKWTPERFEILKKLWADGLSAELIAQELGGVTRNGVIGKVHRTHLPSRGTVRRAAGYKTKGHQPYLSAPKSGSYQKGVRDLSFQNRLAKVQADAATKPHRERVQLIEEVVLAYTTDEEKLIPFEQRKTLLQLDKFNCRWPVGNPGSPDFFFCGATTINHVYCDHHHGRSVQKVS